MSLWTPLLDCFQYAHVPLYWGWGPELDTELHVWPCQLHVERKACHPQSVGSASPNAAQDTMCLYFGKGR